MTREEACAVLGVSPGSTPEEIKKRYRMLMHQVHPDSGAMVLSYPREAHEINAAYSFLKKEEAEAGERKPSGGMKWCAPENALAWTQREIYQYAYGTGGAVIGNFPIARGKYLWTREEEFPLFLLSILRCSTRLLEEIDCGIKTFRSRVQAELSYLLAQQFTAGRDLLEELVREEPKKEKGFVVYHIPAMVEFTPGITRLETGIPLYPLRIKSHRLFLKDQKGRETGYLSFPDDRFYYAVIPLFEQKAAQVKIRTAEKPSPAASCQKLHLWLRMGEIAGTPVDLNKKIESLLREYRSSFR